MPMTIDLQRIGERPDSGDTTTYVLHNGGTACWWLAVTCHTPRLLRIMAAANDNVVATDSAEKSEPSWMRCEIDPMFLNVDDCL